jgi:hypothetical protein
LLWLSIGVSPFGVGQTGRGPQSSVWAQKPPCRGGSNGPRGAASGSRTLGHRTRPTNSISTLQSRFKTITREEASSYWLPVDKAVRAGPFVDQCSAGSANEAARTCLMFLCGSENHLAMTARKIDRQLERLHRGSMTGKLADA